jgi:U2 small nuclear ribonucleoprotein A'
LTTRPCLFTDSTGHKIPTIENLGVAGPQDAIDFTDNDITTVSNFPFSPRLNTLLCARNRIQNVDKRIAEQLPNLQSLVLTNNHVKELADLEGLTGCGALTHLSLLENPVTKKEVNTRDERG